MDALIFYVVNIGWASLQVKIKIIIATLQIVTAAGDVLAVALPKSFERFSSSFNYLELDFSNFFPLGCAGVWSFIDSLIFVYLYPVFI